MTGSVPPLKEVEQKPAASGVKTEKQSSDGGPKQEKGVEDILSQLAKTKPSSSLLRREFKDPLSLTVMHRGRFVVSGTQKAAIRVSSFSGGEICFHLNSLFML